MVASLMPDKALSPARTLINGTKLLCCSLCPALLGLGLQTEKAFFFTLSRISVLQGFQHNSALPWSLLRSQNALPMHSDPRPKGEREVVLVVVKLQAIWRGYREREIGDSTWLKYQHEAHQAVSVRTIQRAVLRALERRRELQHDIEENAERALSIITRVIIAHSRFKAAKRSLSRREHRAATCIAKLQRGNSARMRSREVSIALARHAHARIIQRSAVRWLRRRRDFKLRTFAVCNTCARCGGLATEYIFDLQKAFCANCTRTIAKNLAQYSHLLRRRGMLGTAVSLEEKRVLDDAASKLQRCWRNAVAQAIRLLGSCSACQRAATHLDHALRRLLCRRCAELARTVYRLTPSERRIQTFQERDLDDMAANKISRFWRHVCYCRRWQATQQAYLQLAFKAASQIQRVARGDLIRRVLRSREGAHQGFGTFMDIPGCRQRMHLMAMHDAALANIPKCILGDRSWLVARIAKDCKRRALVRDIVHSTEVSIRRLIRRTRSRLAFRKWREKVEGRRVEIVRSVTSKAGTACRLIQRTARGYIDRRLTMQKRNRRRAAIMVANIACNVQIRRRHAAAGVQSHKGFLSGCVLEPDQILGTCLGLNAEALNTVPQQISMTWLRFATATARLYAEQLPSNKPLSKTVYSEILTLRMGLSPAPDRHFNDTGQFGRAFVDSSNEATANDHISPFGRIPLLQSKVCFPLVLILQIVRACHGTADRDTTIEDNMCVTVTWCEEVLGESKCSANVQNFGKCSFIERQSVFYLTCDALRYPDFFGSRPQSRPLLVLSTTNQVRQSVQSVRLHANDVICSLGYRRTLNFQSNDPRSASVTILLAVEPSARTESRCIVSLVTKRILDDILQDLPKLVPHVKCSLVSYTHMYSRHKGRLHPLHYGSCDSLCATLTWNGADAGHTSVTISPKDSLTLRPESEFILPIELVPNDEPKYNSNESTLKAKQLTLRIDLAANSDAKPWGTAILGEKHLEGEIDRLIVAEVIPARPISNRALVAKRRVAMGYLTARISSFRLPISGWRQRRDAIQAYVSQLISTAISRIPHPRIVLKLVDVSRLPNFVDMNRLQCLLFCGSLLHTIWSIPKREREETDEAFTESAILFLPAHAHSVPDLKLKLIYKQPQKNLMVEVTDAYCLGETEIRGSELITSCGRIDLDLIEPTMSQCKNSHLFKVSRGRISMSVAFADFPRELLLSQKIGKHNAAANVDRQETRGQGPARGDVTAEAVPPSTLQLALLDLDIANNIHTSVRTFKASTPHILDIGRSRTQR